MIAFLKAFSTDLKRQLFSSSFAIMIIIVALSYLVSIIDEMKYAWNSKGSDVLYFWDIAQNIGYFTSISILCCTAINCTSFLNDYHSNYYRSCVMRSGKLNYTLSKYLSCVVTGGLILALGLDLFLMILRIKFPIISEESSYLEMYVRSSDRIFTGKLLYDGNYIGFFGVYTLLAFLFGALWSAVGICLSAFLTDKYVASFSPYVIWYASRGILSGRFRTEVVFNGNYNIGGIGGSILWAAAYFGMVILVLGIIFCRKAERRCEC